MISAIYWPNRLGKIIVQSSLWKGNLSEEGAAVGWGRGDRKREGGREMEKVKGAKC